MGSLGLRGCCQLVTGGGRLFAGRVGGRSPLEYPLYQREGLGARRPHHLDDTLLLVLFQARQESELRALGVRDHVAAKNEKGNVK